MRNLKRALSLVMAAVMLVGMMMVGAGAVSLTDFPDHEKVANTEAVNTLTALSIIKGKDDGNFDPEGIVTRAEMAKMICVAYNGGNDPQLGNAATNTYTDTVGHWAAAYIEYCTNLGIVSGDNTGKFNPNATVTGVEAAKMLLVTIGYNAQVEKFVGAQWDMNVGVRANEKDLYDGLAGMNPSEGLTRDNAAQMIYNAIQAGMVTYTNAFVTGTDGSLTSIQKVTEDVYPNTSVSKTILGTKCGVSKWVGTLEGNTNSLGLPESGNLRVFGQNETSSDSDENADFPYALANDLEWLGEEVCVLYKDSNSGLRNQPDKKDTIFGVYNTGNTKVYTTTVSDIKGVGDGPSDTSKIKFGGIEYKIDSAPANSTVVVTKNYGVSTVSTDASATTAELKTIFETLAASQNGNTVKFVANDRGEICAAYAMESTLSYVTAVNNEKVSLNGVGAIKIEDNDVYDGIAKNDVVVVTKMYPSSNEVYKVVEAETVSGEVGGYAENVSATSSKSVTVDGTTYKVLNKAALPVWTVGDNSGSSYFQTSDIREDYTLYLVNGMVGFAVKTSDDANQYAMVIDFTATNGKLGSTFSVPQVQLLLTDGTKVTGTIHKDSLLYTSDSITHGSVVNTRTSAIANNGTVEVSTALYAGQLVKYSEPSSGVYKIIEIGTYADSDSAVVYDKDLKAFNSTVTSGDCVLFAKVGTEYKAYNIRNLGNVTANASSVSGFYAKDGKVVAAYTELTTRPSGSTNNMFYGIVSASNGVVEVSGDYYNKYTVANNQDEAVVLLPETGVDSGTLSSGAIVGFEKASDDIYKNAEITRYTGTTYDASNGQAAWVKEFSEKDRTITYFTALSGDVINGFTGTSATTKALDDDCAIVYVDADSNAAGSDVGINAFDGVSAYRNVLVIKDASTAKAVAIIVESSGEDNILNPATLTVTVPSGIASGTPAESATATVTSTDPASFGNATGKVSIKFYNDNVKTNEIAAPANLEALPTTLSFNSSGVATLTFTESAGQNVAAGTYYFTVTFNGITSAVVTWTVS